MATTLGFAPPTERPALQQGAWHRRAATTFGPLVVALAVQPLRPALATAGWSTLAERLTVVNGLLLATLVATTATDLRRRRIPNALTYPALVWILLLGAWTAMRPAAVDTLPAALPSTSPVDAASAAVREFVRIGPTFYESLAGAAACFAVMLLVFLMNGGGGGDVKLAAVVGAALGVRFGLVALVIAHLAAGAAGLSWSIVAHGPGTTFGGLGRLFGSALWPHRILPPSEEQRRFLRFPLPLSPFFLIGVIVVLLFAGDL